jgi:N-methylhydantoinase A/oxoprolinase/acetone carboxylase beta subunit
VAPAGTRQVWHAGAPAAWPVWRREAMRPGVPIAGPAIIEEAFATHVLPASWEAEAHPEGALIARRIA